MPREIMNVAFSGSQCSLVMVQALTQWMSTPVVVVGVGFQCHQSPEGDLCFYPVNDQVVAGQPVTSEYHQVFFIQLGYIELNNMRLTS